VPTAEVGIPDAIYHEATEAHQEKEAWLKKVRAQDLERQRDYDFNIRMASAMKRYWAFRSQDENDSEELDDLDLRVIRLPPRLLPSNFYGVHFKDTDEYGVCESYRFDNGSFGHSYRRVADDTFEADRYERL
jgi:hypothetical protein